MAPKSRIISHWAILCPCLSTWWRQRAKLFPNGWCYSHFSPHDGAREQIFFLFFPNGLCYTCIWPQDGAREENYFPMVGVIPVFDHKMETVVFFPAGDDIPAFDHRMAPESRISQRTMLYRIWPQGGVWEQNYFLIGDVIPVFYNRMAPESRISQWTVLYP